MKLAALAFVVVGAACGSDGPREDPRFPADYAATYQEVRPCRSSLEHDQMNVRILVAPDAVDAYNTQMSPFPTGTVVLKEEYDVDDTSCAGPIVDYTVMQKLAVGSAPATIDWYWQRVDAKRSVTESNTMSCIHCHMTCQGYDGTCASVLMAKAAALP